MKKNIRLLDKLAQRIKMKRKYTYGGPKDKATYDKVVAPSSPFNNRSVPGPSVIEQETEKLSTMSQMQQKKSGGIYEDGGMVPGGKVSPIPGSDAVEFMGNKHDEAGMGSESGIILDDNTEVEDGETMDQVTMAKHGGKRKDYFFSEHLKKDGKSYAEHHKQILREGGAQDKIDLLARMQEHAAGRNPKKISSTGGGRYKEGGAKDEALKIKGAFEQDGVVYDRDGRVLYQDMNFDGIDDQTQGITTYHNTPNDVTRTIMENKDISDAVDAHEEATNTTLDKETNTYISNDYPLINGKKMTERQKDFHNKQISQGKKLETDGSYVDDPDSNFYRGEDNNTSNNTSNTETNTATNTATNNNNGKTSNTKGKDNLPVASDIYLPEYGDIPGYQPGLNHQDMQYYMDDAELQKYITGHDNFGEEWMSNISPEVLKEAGITDYNQLNDPKFVTAYQNAWNKLNKDNQIQVDGKFGEQTIRTGFKPEDIPEDVPEDIPEEDGSSTNIDTDDTEKKKIRKDRTGALVNAAQFIPSVMAFLDKPDNVPKADLVKASTIIPERMAKVRLDRVDYNDQLSRNASDANALNRFIETSGGGPASIVNRMAAYGKKQTADMQIKQNETKANAAISNQEAALEAQRRSGNAANALNASSQNAQSQQRASMQNVSNKMTVDEFNAGAKAATKDRRLMAVDNAVKGLATMRTDKLKYEGQERLARAISGQTGVYSRENYGEDLVAAGYEPGTDGYNDLMKNFNLRNKPVVPPKEEKKKENKEEKEESTLARMGGYKKKIRRYGK